MSNYNAFNIEIKRKHQKYKQWFIKSINYEKLINKIIEDIELTRVYDKNNVIRSIRFIKSYTHKQDKYLSIIIIKNKSIKSIKNKLYSIQKEILEECNEIWIFNKYGYDKIYKCHLYDGKENNF